MVEIEYCFEQRSPSVFMHHGIPRPRGSMVHTQDHERRGQHGQRKVEETFHLARARLAIFEIAPPTRLPVMSTASHASPTLAAAAGSAPKGASNAGSTSSRLPMPASVTGTNPESLASGQANNQARAGRWRPQPTPIHALRAMSPV